MSIVDQIIMLEDGKLNDEGIINLFAELIKTGQAWRLQGCYGRMAKSLIDQGYISRTGKILWRVKDV